ncbi:winged helix-turn-helix transcriptional regulator [Aeromicrobium alkaliterrae]|uniref:HTH hxlR-type domain-containing protein n=1 Tax=Aeromicrobium alkaliterrae TaxID=302168 RepID=A0ABP4W686_9ACTN
MTEEPAELEPGGTNAIGRMLGLLGDEWTLLILQHSLWGVRRYGQFMAAIPISNAVLTSRLRLLTDEGLLERRVYQPNPPRAEYRPTARSRSLWPVLLAIWEWERQWVPDHAEGLPAMRHAVCGSDFAPVLGCRACGEVLHPRDAQADWGPSGSWPRSVPAAVTRRRSDTEGGSGQSGLFPDTMAIFGNRWSSALIGAAFRGLTRFSEFETSLGAPPTLIADRLKVFGAIGVLEPIDNLGRSDWMQYRLTAKGRAFFPVVALALQWAEQWFHAPEGAALEVTHGVCGNPLTAILMCDQCGQPLSGGDVLVVSADQHDLLMSGTEHIEAAEVEDVLMAHPGVREVAVIGAPDERRGETPVAFVVVEHGSGVSVDDLFAFAGEHLEPDRRPTAIEVIDSLPRTATGKVLKRDLRAPYWAGHDRSNA